MGDISNNKVGDNEIKIEKNKFKNKTQSSVCADCKLYNYVNNKIKIHYERGYIKQIVGAAWKLEDMLRVYMTGDNLAQVYEDVAQLRQELGQGNAGQD